MTGAGWVQRQFSFKGRGEGFNHLLGAICISKNKIFSKRGGGGGEGGRPPVDLSLHDWHGLHLVISLPLHLYLPLNSHLAALPHPPAPPPMPAPETPLSFQYFFRIFHIGCMLNLTIMCQGGDALYCKLYDKLQGRRPATPLALRLIT